MKFKENMSISATLDFSNRANQVFVTKLLSHTRRWLSCFWCFIILVGIKEFQPSPKSNKVSTYFYNKSIALKFLHGT